MFTSLKKDKDKNKRLLIITGGKNVNMAILLNIFMCFEGEKCLSTYIYKNEVYIRTFNIRFYLHTVYSIE